MKQELISIHNENDYYLSELLESAIDYLADFQNTFFDKNVRREYLDILHNIFMLFENKNIDDFKEVSYKRLYSLYYKTKDINQTEEMNVKSLREQFSLIILKQIPKFENELYEESVWGAISEYVVVDTMEEYSINDAFYYKNILQKEGYETFEKMLEFIRSELIRYHTNIIYIKKIISFMEEFNEKGVFPLDLQFLNRYLNTAISEMILVQTKLFSNANTKKQDNFGFDYLKAFIVEYTKDSKVNQLLGGDVRKKIKDAKNRCKKLEDIRNGVIAHYDIEVIQKEMKDTVSIEELEILFDISVDLLEIMSLHYFERKDITFLKMIEIHGFKCAICENIILNNWQITDLDAYLNLLRRNFIN